MNLSLDSLKEQVSNLSLYDIKAGVRKVQNAVMNYTEMEAKVSPNTPAFTAMKISLIAIQGSRSYE